MSKLIGEFKTFISRGSVLDLAVALVIGSAFSKIVTSFVSDLLMPVISLVLGSEGFDNYKYVITPADAIAGTTENAIYYGRFIQTSLDFVIIAIVVFLLIRTINKMRTGFEKLAENIENVFDGDPDTKFDLKK